MGVSVLSLVDEVVYGGEAGTEGCGTCERSRRRKTLLKEIPLHPADGPKELMRPVGRVGLQEDAATIPKTQAEGGPHAQIAEDDLPHPRSEVGLAEAVEPAGGLLWIGGA